MRSGTHRVSQVSANTEQILGLQPFDVLGRSVADLFGEQTGQLVAATLAKSNWKDTNPTRASVDGWNCGTLPRSKATER